MGPWVFTFPSSWFPESLGSYAYRSLVVRAQLSGSLVIWDVQVTECLIPKSPRAQVPCGSPLRSIPFHVKREAELGHHLQSLLQVRITDCHSSWDPSPRLQTQGSDPPSTWGTGFGSGEARSPPQYLVPEVWGELPQNGGVCRESGLLSFKASSPSPMFLPTPNPMLQLTFL
jgi:hypothetical protein